MMTHLAAAAAWLAGFGQARSGLAGCTAVCADWLRDPMAHPQIADMDLARIADLPSGQLRSAVRE